MSRNYGWGSRIACDAVRMELYRQALKKNMSFLTAQTLAVRFAKFHRFMKSKGISRLEIIDKELALEFGKSLAKKVDADEMSASYAQNLVSAINSVLIIARHSEWVPISPTLDCGIAKRKAVRVKPTLTIDQCERAVRYLRTKGHHRAATVAELAYTFGLRSKEASLLDTRIAKKEANEDFVGTFRVEKGTKGGRKRKVPIQYAEERVVLNHALETQGFGRSLMPEEDTWKTWRDKGLREGRDALHDLNIKGYHEFRAAYAAQRYASLVEYWEAPCNGGIIFDKCDDAEARAVIARELGHGRVDVVSSYVGGRR